MDKTTEGDIRVEKLAQVFAIMAGGSRDTILVTDRVLARSAIEAPGLLIDGFVEAGVLKYEGRRTKWSGLSEGDVKALYSMPVPLPPHEHAWSILWDEEEGYVWKCGSPKCKKVIPITTPPALDA